MNCNIDENSRNETGYRKIELYPDEKIVDLIRGLDEEQRIAFDIAVDYAKSIVKSRKSSHCLPPDPPLLIVQGGAGSGKSTLIDAIGQELEKILRYPGDNPNHPYVLKVAFTGTAAANIKGQTLHSAFAFNFGNSFLSLKDKTRDAKRTSL